MLLLSSGLLRLRDAALMLCFQHTQPNNWKLMRKTKRDIYIYHIITSRPVIVEHHRLSAWQGGERHPSNTSTRKQRRSNMYIGKKSRGYISTIYLSIYLSQVQPFLFLLTLLSPFCLFILLRFGSVVIQTCDMRNNRNMQQQHRYTNERKCSSNKNTRAIYEKKHSSYPRLKKK